jgi:hypothetical protein
MLGQRRYERVAFFCPVQLTVLPAGQTIPGMTFDISIGGVGVATSMMLERGTSVRVRFQFHDAAKNKICEEVFGRVAYSRADEDGDRIGIEFMQTIQESSNPLLARKLNSDGNINAAVEQEDDRRVVSHR